MQLIPNIQYTSAARVFANLQMNGKTKNWETTVRIVNKGAKLKFIGVNTINCLSYYVFDITSPANAVTRIAVGADATRTMFAFE